MYIYIYIHIHVSIHVKRLDLALRRSSACSRKKKLNSYRTTGAGTRKPLKSTFRVVFLIASPQSTTHRTVLG